MLLIIILKKKKKMKILNFKKEIKKNNLSENSLN